MIGYIKGAILHKDLRFLIINTGEGVSGVGYKVYVTPDLISETEIDIHVNLWIHTVVKDDAIDLYGFKNKNSLDFFELLLSVSGIGPKSALNILGLANTNNIRRAVVSQDVAYLTNVSGISKKIAEKIVLELKGKILGGVDVESGDDIASTNRKTINIEVETLEALKALGYTQREAREALENVPREIKETGDISIIIRATLKVLK
jgi:Holliday junction DNA helicase RuvA